MVTKRFVGTVVVVFVILDPDYRPFYGTLLRPMQPSCE